MGLDTGVKISIIRSTVGVVGAASGGLQNDTGVYPMNTASPRIVF
jgi:hypothetical protein